MQRFLLPSTNCDTVSDGGRPGWGCNENENAGHPHLDSFDYAQDRLSPVEGEEIRIWS
jgi:hypothetical protein